MTIKDLEYAAWLVKIDLSEDEKQAMIQRAEKVLAFADTLGEADTNNVEPTARVFEEYNVLRDDVIVPSYARDELIKNAPAKQAGCFSVPKTVE